MCLDAILTKAITFLHNVYAGYSFRGITLQGNLQTFGSQMDIKAMQRVSWDIHDIISECIEYMLYLLLIILNFMSGFVLYLSIECMSL